MKKITFLFALIGGISFGQEFLQPSDAFSHKEITYINLADGTELQGTIDDIDRKKGLIEEIVIKDGNGKKIKFWKVDVAKDIFADGDMEFMKNGTVIVSDKRDGIYIKTKDGILKVLEVQGENAKKMPIQDYLRGNQINEFDVFE